MERSVKSVKSEIAHSLIELDFPVVRQQDRVQNPVVPKSSGSFYDDYDLDRR
jgi:hypothetical protein